MRHDRFGKTLPTQVLPDDIPIEAKTLPYKKRATLDTISPSGNDFRAIHQLVTEVYGVNRADVFKAHVAQSEGGCVLCVGPARVTGFAPKLRQHDLLRVGPPYT